MSDKYGINTVLGDGAADARHVAEGPDGPEGPEGTRPVREVPPSPTVLAVDRWTTRAGKRLATEWSETFAKITDEWGDTINHPNPEALAKQCDAHVAADALETLMAYEPKPSERPEDEHRAKWWQQLLNAPETQALRARTLGSALAAEMAAGELAAAWGAYVVEHPPEDSDGKGGEPGEGDDGEGEHPADTVARSRSVRAALKAAEDAAELGEAAGAGLGAEGGATNAGALAGFARKVRSNHNLAAILRMAGRFTAKAQGLQKGKATTVGMEMTGIELSGEIARALPFEAAQVAGVIEELETLAELRLFERRLFSYRRTKRVPEQLGPIVVSVDESGSMNGDKVVAAKGLALAMASIARAQKRPFLLTSYSGAIEWEGRRPKPTCRTNVAEDTPDGIVAWCETFLSGGSDLDMPLASIQRLWPEGVFKRADHIIISDAEIGEVPKGYIEQYQEWAKDRNIKTFSIIIGHNRPGPFKKVSDGGLWCLKSLDLDNPAVDVVLSI
jgi:uncharacterized protein with von Willebrand factor type A (vWA) domain